VRISAERDIRPESSSHDQNFKMNGVGATSIVRAYKLIKEGRGYDKKLVDKILLDALNKIVSIDGTRYTEILTHQDETDWEIVLRDEKRGGISLSKSGSGLKTIFLV